MTHMKPVCKICGHPIQDNEDYIWMGGTVYFHNGDTPCPRPAMDDDHDRLAHPI